MTSKSYTCTSLRECLHVSYDMPILISTIEQVVPRYSEGAEKNEYANMLLMHRAFMGQRCIKGLSIAKVEVT